MTPDVPSSMCATGNGTATVHRSRPEWQACRNTGFSSVGTGIDEGATALEEWSADSSPRPREEEIAMERGGLRGVGTSGWAELTSGRPMSRKDLFRRPSVTCHSASRTERRARSELFPRHCRARDIVLAYLGG